MFLEIETDPLTLSFNCPWVILLRSIIPDSGITVPIPTMPVSVSTILFVSLLKWNFCCGSTLNSPISLVVPSIFNTVPPTPISNLVLTRSLSTSTGHKM